MLTAKVDKDEEDLGRETGADEYITKPFEWDYLSEKIKEHLGED